MVELTGFNLDLNLKRKQTLEFVLNDLFPNVCDTNAAEFWCGLRPMTHDGTPIIGKTPFENLFTNCGHGTLGWTMACGSGKLLADTIGGKPTDIEGADYSVGRYT
jgi:D-amino-acid dehydrogenase